MIYCEVLFYILFHSVLFVKMIFDLKICFNVSFVVSSLNFFYKIIINVRNLFTENTN